MKSEPKKRTPRPRASKLAAATSLFTTGDRTHKIQDAAPESEDVSASGRIRSRKRSKAGSGKISRLEQELATTKEYLQSVIETQKATNEELQSANEELSTVNDELRSRNQGITQANSDLMNIFASIDVAVIMVGSNLTIRRFTPQAQVFFGLMAGDIGRPLLNINPTIDIPDFQSLVLQVITNSRTVERDLSDAKGVPYQLKILPYRTLDNKIDGAVITITNSSTSKLGDRA